MNSKILQDNVNRDMQTLSIAQSNQDVIKQCQDTSGLFRKDYTSEDLSIGIDQIDKHQVSKNRKQLLSNQLKKLNLGSQDTNDLQDKPQGIQINENDENDDYDESDDESYEPVTPKSNRNLQYTKQQLTMPSNFGQSVQIAHLQEDRTTVNSSQKHETKSTQQDLKLSIGLKDIDQLQVKELKNTENIDKQLQKIHSLEKKNELRIPCSDTNKLISDYDESDDDSYEPVTPKSNRNLQYTKQQLTMPSNFGQSVQIAELQNKPSTDNANNQPFVKSPFSIPNNNNNNNNDNMENKQEEIDRPDEKKTTLEIRLQSDDSNGDDSQDDDSYEPVTPKSNRNLQYTKQQLQMPSNFGQSVQIAHLQEDRTIKLDSQIKIHTNQQESQQQNTNKPLSIGLNKLESKPADQNAPLSIGLNKLDSDSRRQNDSLSVGLQKSDQKKPDQKNHTPLLYNLLNKPTKQIPLSIGLNKIENEGKKQSAPLSIGLNKIENEGKKQNAPLSIGLNKIENEGKKQNPPLSIGLDKIDNEGKKQNAPLSIGLDKIDNEGKKQNASLQIGLNKINNEGKKQSLPNMIGLAQMDDKINKKQVQQQKKQLNTDQSQDKIRRCESSPRNKVQNQKKQQQQDGHTFEPTVDEKVNIGNKNYQADNKGQNKQQYQSQQQQQQPQQQQPQQQPQQQQQQPQQQPQQQQQQPQQYQMNNQSKEQDNQQNKQQMNQKINQQQSKQKMKVNSKPQSKYNLNMNQLKIDQVHNMQNQNQNYQLLQDLNALSDRRFQIDSWNQMQGDFGQQNFQKIMKQDIGGGNRSYLSQFANLDQQYNNQNQLVELKYLVKQNVTFYNHNYNLFVNMKNELDGKQGQYQMAIQEYQRHLQYQEYMNNKIKQFYKQLNYYNHYSMDSWNYLQQMQLKQIQFMNPIDLMNEPLNSHLQDMGYQNQIKQILNIQIQQCKNNQLELCKQINVKMVQNLKTFQLLQQDINRFCMNIQEHYYIVKNQYEECRINELYMVLQRYQTISNYIQNQIQKVNQMFYNLDGLRKTIQTQFQVLQSDQQHTNLKQIGNPSIYDYQNSNQILFDNKFTNDFNTNMNLGPINNDINFKPINNDINLGPINNEINFRSINNGINFRPISEVNMNNIRGMNDFQMKQGNDIQMKYCENQSNGALDLNISNDMKYESQMNELQNKRNKNRMDHLEDKANQQNIQIQYDMIEVQQKMEEGDNQDSRDLIQNQQIPQNYVEYVNSASKSILKYINFILLAEIPNCIPRCLFYQLFI